MPRRPLILAVVDGTPMLDEPDPRKSAGELLYDIALRLRDYDEATHITIEIVSGVPSLALVVGGRS